MTNQIHRDANGRFTPGNPGSPGRKPREVEKEYLEVLTQVVNPEKWRRVCEKAVEDAIQGDARARQWVSDYAMGCPIARVQEVHEEEDSMTKLFREAARELREEEEEARRHVQGIPLPEYLTDEEA